MSKEKKGYQIEGKDIVEVRAIVTDSEVRVHRGEDQWSTSVRRTGGVVRIQLPTGEWVRVEASLVPGGAWISLGGETLYLEMLERKPRGGALDSQSGPVSPMPGVVVRVNVAEGDKVSEGDVLAVVEAMKMEHSVRANSAGTVTRVLVSAGERVDGGALLAEVTGDDGGGDDA